jgi:adenosylcobinamide kinase/adenosylcobinamide-phosphate guanylyltransferase
MILILGGARSGKSQFAEKMATGKVAYVATSEALDDEMRERIRKHQARRPKNWRTFEQPLDIDKLVPKLADEFDGIIIDCATLYVTNIFLGQETGPATEGDVLAAVERLIKACSGARATVIIVSNEVGSGIVPENAMARQFRDIMGFANQRLAAAADEVYFTVAGIPMKIKPAGGADANG